MSDNDQSVPEAESKPAGQTENQSDPSSSGEGQSQDKSSTEAHLNVPEKFKDKEIGEVVKMYGELEKRLGEQSTTVSEAKKIKENQAILSRAVQHLTESDPEAIKKLEAAVAHVTGATPETKTQDKKDGEEAKLVKDPEVVELRQVAQNRTFNEFYGKHGLNKLKADDKKKVSEKIAQELMDLYDPGGVKNWQTILNEIPQSQLPTLLEKAYYLSTLSGAGERSAGDFASLGSMPSSSQATDDSQVSLTADEKQAAKLMGVSEDAWLKQKQKMSEEGKK